MANIGSLVELGFGGFGITQAGHESAAADPGRDSHPYKNGVPQYARLKKVLVGKKLKEGFKA